MALIYCPECNEQISDKAKSCPYCGYPFVSKYSDKVNKQGDFLYKIIITGYRSTDTEIISAVKNVLNLEIEYSQVQSIINTNYAIAYYKDKEEANRIVERLEIYGAYSKVVEDYNNEYELLRFQTRRSNNSEQLKISGGIKAICFFFPIVGLIIFAINISQSPVAAKTYLKFSIIGLVLGTILYLVVI